jgi:hypothetical protein
MILLKDKCRKSTITAKTNDRIWLCKWIDGVPCTYCITFKKMSCIYASEIQIWFSGILLGSEESKSTCQKAN